MADLSAYKEAIANAYEGRAVRNAIVAMVQAVEDAINDIESDIADSQNRSVTQETKSATEPSVLANDERTAVLEE